MSVSLSSTFEELVKEINKKANAGEGGGTSGGNEMPTIRFVGARDTNGSMEISAYNPLTLTVEITSGELQVGDQIQLCARKLYTYQKDETTRERRYKLRAFMNHYVTESELTQKYFMFTIAEDWAIEELCRGGSANDSSRRYPKYIRVRRGYMREDGSTEGAKFSNEVSFECYGYYDGSLCATDGRISIR